MLNKPKDIPYCGVKEHKIADFPIENINLDSLDILFYYIEERYKIHLRKDIEGIKPPYTKDPILRKFRFTNIRREHDTETKWVIKNITSNPKLSYEDKLLNCILFRLFNKHQTAELLGMPIRFSHGYDPEDYRELFELAEAENPDALFFTGAFLLGGFHRGLKQYLPEGYNDKYSREMRVMYLLSYMIDQGVTQYLTSKTAESPEEVCSLLKGYMGIGEFLAYQMFIDMTYIELFPFSENEFTIAGPGAKLGVNFLFDDTERLSPEELIFWLRDNWKALNQYNIQNGNKHTVNPKILMTDLPEYDRVMNVMSLENCLCEFSKYYKAKYRLGRPRKKYTRRIT